MGIRCARHASSTHQSSPDCCCDRNPSSSTYASSNTGTYASSDTGTYASSDTGTYTGIYNSGNR